MNTELEELKQILRSKRFSLDEVRSLAERAVRAIDRLEAENQALMLEFRRYQTAEAQLKKIRETINALLAEQPALTAEQTARRLGALLDEGT